MVIALMGLGTHCGHCLVQQEEEEEKEEEVKAAEPALTPFFPHQCCQWETKY